MIKARTRIFSVLQQTRASRTIHSHRLLGAQYSLLQRSLFNFSSMPRPPMKVLVADQFSDSGIEEMRGSGLEVTYDAQLQGEKLAAKLT